MGATTTMIIIIIIIIILILIIIIINIWKQYQDNTQNIPYKNCHTRNITHHKESATS
jgi:predicted PurR-regulated permease PerM